jgi:hypothetical protein
MANHTGENYSAINQAVNIWTVFDINDQLLLNETEALQHVTMVVSHELIENPMEFIRSAIVSPFPGERRTIRQARPFVSYRRSRNFATVPISRSCRGD